MANKKEDKKNYKILFIKIKEIINEFDPINLLKQGMPGDEYEGEIQSIVGGLSKCNDIPQVQLLIFSIFKDSFGANSAGSIDLYLEPAKKFLD